MWDKTNQPIIRSAFGVPMPDGTQTGNAPTNMGCVPGSRMAASTNPTANDTVTIGGVVFKCVASLGAAVVQVQFLRGGSAAVSYANLVDAINGKASTKGTAWVEATTPFAATVVADMVTATQLRLRWATARGGLPLAAVPTTTALAASITAGAAAWSTANLNTNGKSPQDVMQAYGSHVVTAAEVTAAFIDIELEFQPTMQDIYVTTSAGVLKTITEQVTIPANQNSLHITTGTGGTALVAGDIVYWWAAV